MMNSESDSSDILKCTKTGKNASKGLDANQQIVMSFQNSNSNENNNPRNNTGTVLNLNSFSNGQNAFGQFMINQNQNSAPKNEILKSNTLNNLRFNSNQFSGQNQQNNNILSNNQALNGLTTNQILQNLNNNQFLNSLNNQQVLNNLTSNQVILNNHTQGICSINENQSGNNLNNNSLLNSLKSNSMTNSLNNNQVISGFNNIQGDDDIKDEMKKRIKLETNSNHSGSGGRDNCQSSGLNNMQTINRGYVSNPSPTNMKSQYNNEKNEQQQQQKQQQIQYNSKLEQQQQSKQITDDTNFHVLQSNLQQLKQDNIQYNQQLQQQQQQQKQIHQVLPELTLLLQNQNQGQQFQLQSQQQQIQQNQSQQQLQQYQSLENNNSLIYQLVNSLIQQQQPQTVLQQSNQMSQMTLNNMINQNVYESGNISSSHPVNNQNIITEEKNQNNNNKLTSQIQDFYSKMISFEEAQANMINELNQSNDNQFDLILNVRQELMQIRESIKINNSNKQQVSQGTQQQQAAFDHAQIEKSNLPHENPIGQGTNGLLQYLFKQNESDYKYELKPYEVVATPFYRERNFSIKLQLQDRAGNIVQNQNKITLTIALYTSENPPQVIKQNTLGNQILKGFLEKELHQGKVSFEKIQIKEVTSHYLNGWIYMIIFPKHPKVDSKQKPTQENSSVIDFCEIKPLILERITVKAKKMRDNKAQNSENNEQCYKNQTQNNQKNEEDKSSQHSDYKLSQNQNNSNANDGSCQRDEIEENEDFDEVDIDNDEDEDSINNQKK